KDQQENRNYRNAYKSCEGTYALSVPFAERFFQLARLGDRERVQGGLVGQITSNSFMKREFGRKLIEEYFTKVDLEYVIDTSGAYIPGHGTPTVILIGRRQWPKPGSPVRAVMGIQGEPSRPIDPARGHVWSAIVETLRSSDSAAGGEWVSQEKLPRETLDRHL